MNPVVSVLMPVYNCAAFVEQAVDSVLAQEYPHKELIVVDDGSSDGTAERLARYGPRIRLVRQDNRGAAAARNAGLRHATGDWIAFLDGDDVWLPGKLAAQMAWLRAHPDAQLVYGSWREWRADAAGNWPDPLQYASGYDDQTLVAEDSGWVYARLLLDSLIHTITVLISAELLRSAGGFDEELRVGEDYDLWLRLSQRVPVAKLSMVMAAYRIHPFSTTRRPPVLNYGHRVVARAVERYGLRSPDGSAADRDSVRRRLQRLSIDFGYHHLRSGDACAAAQAFQQARRDGARSPRLAAYELAARLRCAWQWPAGENAIEEVHR